MRQYDWLVKAIEEPGEACIFWPAEWSTNAKGYASVWVPHEGMSRNAANAALRTVSTPLHTDMEASHGTCNDRRCINPNHLSWKTHADNIADKERDGTYNPPPPPVTKLSQQDYDDIREGTGTHADIAKRYGVARSTISNIIGYRGCYSCS